MLHSYKLLLAIAVVAAVAAVPATSQAESAKSDKTESAGAAKKGQAASDDFEENRRAHMQKSKENNTKKGEN